MATSRTRSRYEEVMREHGMTHILHLAALQVPFRAREPGTRSAE